MNIKKLYISVAFFYFWPIIKTEPIIQVNLLEDVNEKILRLNKKIEKKGTVGKAGLDHYMQATPVSGFFSMYAGMLTLSDSTGAIRFPRRHTETVVYVAITQDIEPIMRIENTVHHWQFVPNTPVSFYKLEPTINKQNNRLTWGIQELEIPVNHIIPAEAVVIFGDPAYFYFDSTIEYVAYVEPNIFLPPIVIKKGTNAIKSSLHLLSIRHFFGSLKSVVSQTQKSYRSMVQP